jgi:hypothetical protein
MADAVTLPPAAELQLVDLARLRLADVVGTGGGNTPTSTLDAVMCRLFDRDHRELLTYSAFGSAL